MIEVGADWKAALGKTRGGELEVKASWGDEVEVGEGVGWEYETGVGIAYIGAEVFWAWTEIWVRYWG